MVKSQLGFKKIKLSNNLEADLNENVKLLVIPGGDSIKMYSEISETSQKIENFVKNGGKLLGICAGGMVVTNNHLRCIHPTDKTCDPEVLDLVNSERAYSSITKLPNLYPGMAFSPLIVVKKKDPASPENICAITVATLEEPLHLLALIVIPDWLL